ncbi:hypothetical protein B0G71_4349 [Paraburkholderia sp. BL27I4N3]|uniref:hypothetical protein n=1 Tax=Paraburkholderia sp. BL27I4N3 TaxID=1938805 RepID=UPI000E249475|nr:hypothetical protein [Paraburkholderia sp. BL27I4N3]REE21197.1 hypothetical protein B0G71_4349 [Paraburkholderia sp. BL27I4N3]
MKGGWRIPLAALIIIILIAAFNAKPMTSAADIAAWVQGVGSLLAIGAAVWIYARQYQDKKADDEATTVAFVQAMRAEVNVFWTVYCRDVQPHLTDMFKHHFEEHAPLHVDQLMIYRAAPAAIGKVDDRELRDLAVKVHAVAFAMISGFELNTVMLRDLLPLEPFYHHNGKEFMIVDERRKELSNHRQRLKAHDRELSEVVPKFLSEAEKWLASHPMR